MRKNIQLLLFLLIAALLAGCTWTAGPVPSAAPLPSPSVAPIISPVQTPGASAALSPTARPVIDVEIRYDAVDACAREFLGENFSIYQAFIEAVRAREDRFAAPTGFPLSMLDLYIVFSSYCPLQAFVTEIRYNDEDKTIELLYRFPQEEHFAQIAFFENKYREILTDIIRPEDNDLDKLLAVYRYFATNLLYDYSFDPANGEVIQVYDALVSGYGVCHTYANACKFALSQLDIETCEGRSMGPNGADDQHAWFLAKLDGVWYHFDPTWENGTSGGFGLNYFGFTDEMRCQEGEYQAPYPVGVHPWDSSAPACVDTALEPLHNVYDWARLPSPHLIHVWLYSGEQAVYNTQTKQFTLMQ